MPNKTPAGEAGVLYLLLRDVTVRLPAPGRRVPGPRPLLLVEVLRVCNVPLEGVEIKPERLRLVGVVELVDLHDAHVAPVHFSAYDVAVAVKVPEAGLTARDVRKDGRVGKVVDDVFLENLGLRVYEFRPCCRNNYAYWLRR